jgi:hypothetical protein
MHHIIITQHAPHNTCMVNAHVVVVLSVVAAVLPGGILNNV